MAIGTAGRRAAKKYGFLVARKMFPKLFKQVSKKKSATKTPERRKGTDRRDSESQ